MASARLAPRASSRAPGDEDDGGWGQLLVGFCFDEESPGSREVFWSRSRALGSSLAVTILGSWGFSGLYGGSTQLL